MPIKRIKVGDGSLTRIELVGLPGSGKSTVASALLRTGLFQPLQPALRRAAGRLLAQDVLGKPWLTPVLANEIGLRLCLGRPKVAMRRYFDIDAELCGSVTKWIRVGASNPAVTNLRLLEHISTFMYMLSRRWLFEYTKGFRDKPLLIDEDWVNFSSFMLNWSDEDAWLDWAERVLSLVTLPDWVVWLRGAKDVTERRQLERKKVAALFDGCSDFNQMAEDTEARFQRLIPFLRERTHVIEVDATLPVDTVCECIERELFVGNES